ncbi:MAG: hypothetical protein B7Z60_03770 [Ferrovum sp. 37-45-19]|uniref:NAD-dependent succinate-semialdehyde dehydrogenase n=1 Tax=Ferrovum sp. JA12 TaxID=1356299 RepID=UPI000703B2A1|nr:NAD-dependent succinate-semialdehyde dehydrogenase [Ferrovum sp. JA12]OYV78915.1 MAG: hypothetical protein B7Z65_08340 [Ferrovum sp. 21-44-67]OYV94919.1 MAG: hypothetical protein B7Z60_03770 [Ferrovum sp. 37-45-19]HQT82253.1 NAD-dependent succinate-semialdehyde dehydrogenase [Ferrovaceae bacterium]KRH79335.1 succinate semialdehyde dehydrogenase [NAD(P)+] Sad [Ferrovum sp. JA12]HQU06817.1 NAD-dependent succinate-semialdehyde dehydrogenase [Ferrovaceae bacterium]
MPFVSLDPTTEQLLQNFTTLHSKDIHTQLSLTHQTQNEWKKTPFAERALLFKRLHDTLLAEREELAVLMTTEMGKPIKEARSEVEKCAQLCVFYAERGAQFLAAETLIKEADVVAEINYFPLGLIFGVMPWNFPLWQVLRFAVPAIMAGNGVVFKHAPNVPRNAIKIIELFVKSGFPENLISHLMIEDDKVKEVIDSPHIHAVTVTGSDRAGRAVAALSGAALKKCILELGGSDPFVVLADADLSWTLNQAMISRFTNGGQACISAKRFIVVKEVYESFKAQLVALTKELTMGNPLDEDVRIGPLARSDLRDQLAKQVASALEHGAVALTGANIPNRTGWYYEPTVLENVTTHSPVWKQELFGPVAILMQADNEEQALELANDTPYGLGSSVWSKDTERARHLADQIEAGATFVNSLVRSDPRVPFGGTKQSGFGRELSAHGIREFTNIKTLWIKSL